MTLRNKKEQERLIIYSIRRLANDNNKKFICKKKHTNGYDLYEIIQDQEFWVYSCKNLSEIHNALCVIYNFLQTEKVAKHSNYNLCG